ncbi:hypothetical protein DO97_14545 [Neosynechococcus sphagnicola sy1]|uniref:DUF565 domain-containing protein n=1 Tax=Neosynechococcus sphagnicola sy1 TaxID=1497020 RepID=A0A098TIC3_9CYAN|nr:DUF565 domain-containing protein [Neosynechococcus sphagnicola]KGF71859.1 hypothetical protein DO97_14545 [Neosynechococcus sphagnicola sy1]
MQNTRLNGLVESIGQQIGQQFRNPWRRLAFLVMSLLLGFFLGTAISTISGQTAIWDISAAALLVVMTEVINRIVYGKAWPHSLLLEGLNSVKIGIMYGLFVEAFKLGS